MERLESYLKPHLIIVYATLTAFVSMMILSTFVAHRLLLGYALSMSMVVMVALSFQAVTCYAALYITIATIVAMVNRFGRDVVVFVNSWFLVDSLHTINQRCCSSVVRCR